jgi:hypothetical protein
MRTKIIVSVLGGLGILAAVHPAAQAERTARPAQAAHSERRTRTKRAPQAQHCWGRCR